MPMTKRVGGVGLIHLGVQGLVVGAGGSGNYLDGYARLICVHLGDLLQGVVGLGLEVQPVDGAGVGTAFVFAPAAAAAGQKGERHGRAEGQGQEFLASSHFIVLLQNKIFPDIRNDTGNFTGNVTNLVALIISTS